MVEKETSITKKVETNQIELPNSDWKKELDLVREITAKNCNDTEFKLLLFMAQEYGVSPLKKQIWAVKFQGKPVQVYLSRDGLIHLAHQSGQFGSMSTTVEFEPDKPGFTPLVKKPVSATCKIWRKDYDKPFECTVYFKEYDQKQALWISKPAVMISKVAESTCLRRAFDVSGAYDPSEMPPVNNGGNGNASKLVVPKEVTGDAKD
jgi:phage recombination protein Bet